MRSEHNVRLFSLDCRNDFFDGSRRERCLCSRFELPCLEHAFCCGDATHLENLRPTIAKPTVANDQAIAARGKLPGNRLHAEGTTAGHNNRGLRVVHLLERRRDVVHHFLKGLRHVIQRTVRVHDGVLKQTVGVDVWK